LTEALTPEELAATGRDAFERGEFAAAANAFQAAADGYSLAEDPLNAAEMKNNCSVARLQGGDAPGALAAVRGTAEVFAEEEAMREQALALGNEAAALQALGKPEEAETLYRQSADLLAETGEDELRASVLRSISELQLKQGRHLEAVASMHAGLEGLEKPKPRQRLVRKLLEMPFKFLNRG
jgi:tetratricopeptide (TPR) repeat protein